MRKVGIDRYMIQYSKGLLIFKSEMEEDLERLKPHYERACERMSDVIDLRDEMDKKWFCEYRTKLSIYQKILKVIGESQ